jgi:hypothetical protein
MSGDKGIPTVQPEKLTLEVNWASEKFAPE